MVLCSTSAVPFAARFHAPHAPKDVIARYAWRTALSAPCRDRRRFDVASKAGAIALNVKFVSLF